ncbi:hypothetical protein BJY52DRAFT_1183607 [Lactarius psammicola]|nr:hypothetical protein BJY52DRAFT_1183607 [Lactarius psammicola]
MSTFKSQARNWLSVVAYPTLFLSLQFVSSLRPSTDAVPITSLELAVVEALKLTSNLLIQYRSGEGLFCNPQGKIAPWDASQDVEEQPLQGLTCQDSDERVVSSGEDVGQELADASFTVRSCLAAVFASVVWASAAYTFSSALFFFDAVTVHLAAAASIVFVLYGFYAFAGQHIGTPVLQSTVLQIYRSHAPILLNRLNTLLFSSGLCFHVVVCIYQATFTPTSPTALVPRWTLLRISVLVMRARLDWTILSVIRDHDAILERVLYSLSLALLFLVISALNASFSLAVLAGSSVALWTSISYVSEFYKSHHFYDTPENESSIPTRRRRTIAGAIFAVLGLGSIIGATESILFRSEHPILASNVLSSPARPTYISTMFSWSSSSATHATIPTLDFYRDVYAEYFPNILFIGPANREDAGFEHSYDVFVDTYHAAEDLSNPDEYKMAGRMAHHMLYIAMQEHPSKFWYHSPFGRYVPNPALDPSASMSNASLHAPPANISPDPADMPPWKGWGEDWWSPYVGLPCVHAGFQQGVRGSARPPRCIDGATRSPHRRLRRHDVHPRKAPGDLHVRSSPFSCKRTVSSKFAAPTALHLALPRDEDILYVDHWWIWQPPFDTGFVRGKWAEGREVDTFHAFHWGELSEEGGVWEPRPERIEDVRQLLRDSASRQAPRALYYSIS